MPALTYREKAFSQSGKPTLSSRSRSNPGQLAEISGSKIPVEPWQPQWRAAHRGAGKTLARPQACSWADLGHPTETFPCLHPDTWSCSLSGRTSQHPWGVIMTGLRLHSGWGGLEKFSDEVKINPRHQLCSPNVLWKVLEVVCHWEHTQLYFLLCSLKSKISGDWIVTWSPKLPFAYMSLFVFLWLLCRQLHTSSDDVSPSAHRFLNTD